MILSCVSPIIIFFCTHESCRHRKETNVLYSTDVELQAVSVVILDVLEESLLQHRRIINFFKDFIMNTHLFLPALREGKTVDMQDTGSRVPTNQLLCPDAVMHPNIYTPHHYVHYTKQENGHTQVKDIR